MIESSDETIDPKSTPDPLPETATSPAESSAVPSPEDPLADDGLPEWEPLTPELVEDEAIRGDFVLRWVVVGLALLLGISQISETRTLVHLKTGQYLLQNGLLPPAKDVFSYTASERRWVNLSWLFDVVSAGFYAIGGGIGLSVVQGLLAALTFGLLVHALRMNIRTWWGSLCAALALLVCYPQFTIQPELVTLLGVSLVLWILVKSEESEESGRVWLLVPTLLVWAQLDPRAWIGFLLILAWTAGEWLSDSASGTGLRRRLTQVTAASFIVMAVHPFTYEVWLAPLRLYSTEYPAFRFAYPQPSVADQIYHPLVKPFFWRTINHRSIATLVLFGMTIVTMLLNRSRVRVSHYLAFLSVNVLSLFAMHELAVASLVNCVICTVNAQEWYRDRFGQVYSIDWRELLFSRGGRAVTVLSFFAFAWLILSGRLDGPAGKRTGMGFDSHLAAAMSEYQDITADLVDQTPFNFSLRQGDLMIWGGVKPFVDSRAGLYFGKGTSNLLDLHNRTRKALRQKQDNVIGSGEPEVWKATFDKYQLRQAWPRLNGPVPPPDYPTFFSLLSSDEFELASLKSATAIFVRTDTTDPLTTNYRKDHPFDLVKWGFRTPAVSTEDLTREWSKPATTYDNLFSLRRPTIPAGVQAGQHFIQLGTLTGGMPNSARAACALLAIRHANEGLREEPNSAEGYRVLGMSYSLLGQLETMIVNQGDAPGGSNLLRYYQTIVALRQAATLEPDDAGTLQMLLRQYQMMDKRDVQLNLLNKLKVLRPYSKSMTTEQRQEREAIIDAIDQLSEPMAQIESAISKRLDDGSDRFQVASGAYQMGYLLSAIKILEEDAIYLERNPPAKLALASWLLEVGQGVDAEGLLESLEGFATDTSLTGWRDSAAITALCLANHVRTIKLWTDQRSAVATQPVPLALYTLPFLTLNPLWMGPDSYPSSSINANAGLVQGLRFEGANLTYQIALVQMEAGLVEDAGKSIRQALQTNPATPLRPILRFYLECLTGEQVELEPPAADVEEVDDLVESPPTDSAESKEKTESPQK
ncbi:hypothetical protein [Schlesneria sp. T3-172]|uniref:hypothetical protein n=1 Tax=Schlesneria sphaerica TaxID=3373610 RepID=UPI0037C5A5EB